MGIKAPSAPQMPPIPTAARQSTLGSPEVLEAGQLQKERAAAAQGMGVDNTVKTSMQGASTPETAKTFLG